MKKADDFYYQHKQLDSAIYYFQKLRLSSSEFNTDFILYKIAQCYFQLQEYPNAEKYFLSCLEFKNRENIISYFQSMACVCLCEINLAKKNYSAALEFLTFSKTKFKPTHRMCSWRRVSVRFDYAFLEAQCYYGLGNLDTVIHILAPIAIRYYNWDSDYDSTKYERLSSFFVNTLFEKFGVCETKNRLQTAIDNMTYTMFITFDSISKVKFFNIKYNLSFLNNTQFTFELNEIRPDDLNDVLKSYSKKAILKDFKSNPTYRLITQTPLYN